MLSTLTQKLAIAIVCLSLTACATYERAKPAPAMSGSISVKVNDDTLSGWSDLPIGAYKVPESDVIVTGHQRGHVAGVLFGVVGQAITHMANSNSAAAGVSNVEQILRIKLSDRTRGEIENMIAEQPLAAKFSMQPGDAQLDVSSALLLSYVNDTDVRPFVVLKVALKGTDDRPSWETRYFASTGQARPLEGADSWTANDGEPLRTVMAANLRQAVKVMLNDVAQPYTRNDRYMMVVEADFPYLRQRMQILGYKLMEDEKYIAFVPKVGDVMVLSGVNVFDKSVTVYRPAKADDVVFKPAADVQAPWKKPSVSPARISASAP